MKPRYLVGDVLTALGITRDSVMLLWTKWVGLAVALAPSAVDLTCYGVPAKVIAALRFTALIVSVSSAQHRTSSLAGDPK